MATIIRGTVPATEFALSHTLETVPAAEFECERIVRSGEHSIMPLLWVRADDAEAVEDALAADPTVEAVNRLSSFDDEHLYEMQWIDHVRLLLHMLTNGGATVLDAYGRDGRWQLRVLYPNRDHFSTTHEFADEHGMTFDVESIREMDGEPAGRFGLTDAQHEALTAAAKAGYYEVPREVTLEELADDLGVSHQALSEQLRRGTCALLEDTLLIGMTNQEGV
ncbi:DNA binding domain-containing protein [Salinarchaeum sp. Harcht-Bsk1]|uniref:helix-turn-helix domain-containing protein n=1 Tax=Salinarchaeum sp. Harcht-Bsk1 TaxID=1333523 RepID=UPI0003423527|nr:helix-turn-helix domain-containing protein [Salinarchaeum sp. Harcht-Bsk1]AGN00356.1 DNA binding domain-containing protein [Salinarchaeum sp. Harcht-Bsk1]